MVPFLLIHGDADPIVPLQQSQKMVEVLKAAGGLLSSLSKKEEPPRFTIYEEVKVIADWFDKQLAGSQAASPK